MRLLCKDSCMGGCASSGDLAHTVLLHPATSSHTCSGGPPTLSISPFHAWVCTELRLYLWHTFAWLPLPPALSVSLPPISSEHLSISDIALCFGSLFSALLFKSRFHASAGACTTVAGKVKQEQPSSASLVHPPEERLVGKPPAWSAGLSSATVNGPLLPSQRHLIGQRSELAPQEYPGTAKSLSRSQTRTYIQKLGLFICPAQSSQLWPLCGSPK